MAVQLEDEFTNMLNLRKSMLDESVF